MVKRKSILIISGGILICAIIGIFYLKYKIEQAANQITLKDISLEKVKDGTYTGSYELGPCAAISEIIIKDHRIIDIRLLKHEYGLGKKAKAILNDVVEEQSLKVDTVSGATISSKVILASIEDALK